MVFITVVRLKVSNKSKVIDGSGDRMDGADSGGDGSLAYNNTSGVITYTGPSAAETRAHFTGGTGVAITDGSVAIGQSVATDSNVSFNDLTLSGNLTINGTTTNIDTTNLVVEDPLIKLSKNNSNDSVDIGIYGLYGTSSTYSGLFREGQAGSSVTSEGGFAQKWSNYQSFYSLSQGDVTKFEHISKMNFHECLMYLEFVQEKTELESRRIKQSYGR